MRKGKKLSILLMMLLLMGCLVACGKKSSDETTTQNTEAQTVEKEGTQETTEAAEETEKAEEVAEIEVPQFDRGHFPRIDGSTATLPVGRMLYRMSTGASELDATTDIQFSKTTESYLKLMDGEVDLVIAYEAGEKAKSASKYKDLEIVPIGLDALVFLCNQANPVENLSTEEIQGIYTGKYTNWEDVGGDKHEIVPFQRPMNSGSQTLMERLMMQNKKMMHAPEELTPGEMGELIEAVASYDNSAEAIGYSVYYYAANMYQVPEVKLIAVDGVMPDSQTIRSGEYSYVNPFYVAIRKDTPADSPAKVLFDWFAEADGQSLINDLGYVGIKDSAKALPSAFKNPEVSVDTGDKQLVISAELYNGNAGILVFDSHLKPEKFISEVDLYGGDDYQIVRNNLILGRSTKLKDQEKSVGLYDIKNQSWVIEPGYESAARLFDGDKLVKYYLYNYDFVDGFYAPTVLSVDADGKALKDYIDEDTLYEAFRSTEPKEYEMNYEDGYYDLSFGARIKLHREDGYTGNATATLLQDGKVVEKASSAYALPIEGMYSSQDQFPNGHILIEMYDIVDIDTWETTNNRAILIDEKGDIVYKISLAPNEWVAMTGENYYMTVANDRTYKICATDGKVITSWRYYNYDDTADEEENYGDVETIANNGHYFVKIDDKVYFREYGKRALENPTIFGQYLLTPMGESSYIVCYDETTGMTESLFEDFGFGNMVYMDGIFFLNGLDFRTNTYGDPYLYAVRPEGYEVKLPEIMHGKIKGVSANNDILFLANDYVDNQYQPTIVGVNSSGKKVFTIESDCNLTYIGTVEDYVIYAETIYSPNEPLSAKIWSRNIYNGGTALLYNLYSDEAVYVDSFEFGELFTANGACYFPVIATAGSGAMFENGYVINYVPGVEYSGVVANEFYESASGEILTKVDGVERRFRDHGENTYYVKQGAFEMPGDLYLKHQNGKETLQVKGLIPGAGYYDTRKALTLDESVDGVGYMMLATQIYDPEGSIGWRDGFRLLQMEYIRVDGSGGYEIIDTVEY